MTLNTVLNSLNFFGFSKADENRIKGLIKDLYQSKTARRILNKIDANNTFEFNFIPQAAFVFNPFEMDIDFALIDNLSYITNKGEAIAYEPSLILMHEFVHAIEGLDDEPRDFGKNSAGPTQRLTNKVHRELGFPERISYEGTATTFDLPVGTQFTGGKSIDVALLSTSFLDTSSNGQNTDDLLIGIEKKNPNNLFARQKFPYPNFFRAGKGDDFLYGRNGSDTLDGGAGDDLIDGGAGRDVAVYTGACKDYRISRDGNTFEIRDLRVNSPDGEDTLKGIERVRFTDGEIKLEANHKCPGTNVMLVVDTSDSMVDDIDAVRTSAKEIVDEIFGDAKNPVGSRLGIITYNDTGSINTLLSLTDNKQKAIKGIDRLRVEGGGQEPLNGALLSALRGEAGDWGSGSTSNRIVVFSDEPAADPELRPQVLDLAKNTNTSLVGANSVAPQGNNVFEFSSLPLPQESVVPVSISAVVLPGADFGTAESFEDFKETGGEIFTANDISEVVDTLINAIDPPQAEIIGTDQDDILTGTTSDDTLLGLGGDDVLTGLTGNDSLVGGDGIDRLKGKDGNDILVGGAGVDFLTGNKGADRFVLDRPKGKHDRITDFEPGDLILLEKDDYSSLPLGRIKETQFTIGAKANKSTRLQFNPQNGALYFDSNGSSPQGRSLIAILDRGAEISHRAFRVI